MKKNNIVKITFNGKTIGYIYENPTFAQRVYCFISRNFKG